jgi:hypothetical protein
MEAEKHYQQQLMNVVGLALIRNQGTFAKKNVGLALICAIIAVLDIFKCH